MVIDHCNKRPQSVRHKAAWTPTFKKYLSQNLKLIKDKVLVEKIFCRIWRKKPWSFKARCCHWLVFQSIEGILSCEACNYYNYVLSLKKNLFFPCNFHRGCMLCVMMATRSWVEARSAINLANDSFLSPAESWTGGNLWVILVITGAIAQ